MRALALLLFLTLSAIQVSALSKTSLFKRNAISPQAQVEIHKRAVCLNFNPITGTCTCPPTHFGDNCELQAWKAILNGANERPSVDSPYTGESELVLYDGFITIITSTSMPNITASHIHIGGLEESGPVIFGLGVEAGTVKNYPTPTAFSATNTQTLRELNAYVNVHTTRFPSGEIRGQLLPYDACADVDCGLNQGCISTGFSHECICIEGFTGANCEIPPDPCAFIHCDHGGTCVSPSSPDESPYCLCSPIFGGEFCEILPVPCTTNSCMNAGTCVTQGGNDICLCPPNWTGEFCEMANGVQLCALEPCQNGGACVGDLDNLHVCDCAPTFLGLYCDSSSVCSSSSCVGAGASVPIASGNLPVASSVIYSGARTLYTQIRLFTDITHPNPGNLAIYLSTPFSVFPLSSQQAEGAADAFRGTVWTSSAAHSVTSFPFVSGTPAAELRPQVPFETIFQSLPEDADLSGVWMLLIIDTTQPEDGTFNGWRLEFDHENQCDGIVCEDGKTCFDGFNTHYCVEHARPCIPGKTCMIGQCGVGPDGPTCQCYPGMEGEFCASTICSSQSCGISGVEVPVDNTLSPLRSTVTFQGQPSPIPPNAFFQVYVEIKHSYNDDLTISLTSPSGTKIKLASRHGGAFKDMYSSISFVNRMPTESIAEVIVSQDGPLSPNIVQPLESFDAFVGEDPNGQWVLEIIDEFSLDNGYFTGWSIFMEFVDPCLGVDCENGTVCIGVGVTYYCGCPPGTFGADCEPVAPCFPSPCLAGFCLEGDGDFTCDCYANAGELCDIEICNGFGCGWTGQQGVSNYLPPTISKLAFASLPPIHAHTKIKLDLQLVHQYPSELIVTLTSPQGTVLTISNHRGSQFKLFEQVSFGDAASVSIVDSSLGGVSFFKPETPFSTLIGEDPNGIWTLEITDSLHGEDGILKAWSLEIMDTTPPPPTSCDPATLENAVFSRSTLNTVTFGTCLSGYLGQPSRRCNSDGTLGPALSHCYLSSNQCPPQTFANALWDATNITLVSLGKCLPGWAGSPSRRCTLQGKWEDNVAKHCQRVVCQPATLDHAVFQATNALQKAKGTCQLPFAGTVWRECLGDGSFGAASGACVGPCGEEVSYARAAWAETAPGEVATGTCQPGWQGFPTRKCNPDGTWSTNVANHCQKKVCSAVTENNSDFPAETFGQTSFGTCHAGYSGKPFRICESNGFFGTIQRPCVPQTAQCSQETYANAVWDATGINSLAFGKCVDGYHGNPSRNCFLAQWSTTVNNHCQRNFCPPSNDGMTSFKKIFANEQAYGTCLIGSGRPWRRCNIDGTPGPIINPCKI